MAGRPEVTDLVVCLPGIMGSTLAQDRRLIWAPSAGAVAQIVRTFGDSLNELRLPDGIGDDHPGDGVEPVGLMPDLHVLPGILTAQVGYGALLIWLQRGLGLVPVTWDGPPGNLLQVPYDWRLSNRYNGRRLAGLVEDALGRWRAQGGRHSDAKVVFICHSMGGLVARWYLQREGGAAITRKLITLGTPHRGSVKALEQLVNGVRKGPGPFRLDLTDFARSLPSTHQLLPQYACVEGRDGLAKVSASTAPTLNPAMVADAMRFHAELNDELNPGWGTGVDLHPIQGQKQATATTARIVDGQIVTITTIDEVDEGGDGTVPALSAMPVSVPPTSPTIRHVTERHGSLQSNPSVFEELEGILTASTIIHRATVESVDVRVDDVVEPGESILIEAVFRPGDEARPTEARLLGESGIEIARTRLTPADDAFRATFDPVPEGGYEVVVRGHGSARGQVTEVTAPVFVWGAER